MGTIRIILRVDKPLKTNQCPIDIIYQVSGQRKYYRTDIKLYPESWDPTNQKIIFHNKAETKALLSKHPGLNVSYIPTLKEIEEYNDNLQHLTSYIRNIEKGFILKKVPYSSEMVIEQLRQETKGYTKKESSSNVIFEFMQKYIDDHKTTREAGSLSVYKSVKNHLQNYCKTTGKKVTFDNIDYNFFQSFQNYLIDVEKLNNTTTAKQLSTVKTFLNYARKQGIQVTDKFKDFKIKRESLCIKPGDRWSLN